MRDEYYSSKEVRRAKCQKHVCVLSRQKDKRKKKSFLELTAHFKTTLVEIKSCVVLLWYFVCVFVFYHTLNVVFCFVFILAMKSAFTSILWCRLNCTGEGITQY